jgi:hypothetical protein
MLVRGLTLDGLVYLNSTQGPVFSSRSLEVIRPGLDPNTESNYLTIYGLNNGNSFERVKTGWDAGNIAFLTQVEVGGTGTPRKYLFRSTGDIINFTAGTHVQFGANGNLNGDVWVSAGNFFDAEPAGTLTPRNDNSIDFGTNASRWRDSYFGRVIYHYGVNGQSLGIKSDTEVTTITTAATTNTTIMFPKNCLHLGASVLVIASIPTAATFSVGTTENSTRYGTGITASSGSSNAQAGTTNPIILTSTAPIVFTPNVASSAATGKVRTTIYYIQFTAPNS